MQHTHVWGELELTNAREMVQNDVEVAVLWQNPLQQPPASARLGGLGAVLAGWTASGAAGAHCQTLHCGSAQHSR